MDADQLVSFILDKKWLALAILVIGYVTRLLSDESKFPLSVPARWRPVIIVVLGQLLGGLVLVQGGASWKVAIATGLAVSFATMGLFDLVVKAIFNGSPPWWIDILALVFPTKKPDVPRPPKLPMMMIGVLVVFLAACAEAVKTSCAIIDVADQACTVLVVPGPDGGAMRVQVTRDELRRFAHETDLKHAAMQDGGAR